MEAISDMKKLLLFACAILAFLSVSCNQDLKDSDTIELIVNTGDIDTKTAVVLDSDQYKSTWKAGDKIYLMEMTHFYSSSYSATDLTEYSSSPLTADTKTASFPITLIAKGKDPGDKYRYIMYYPVDPYVDGSAYSAPPEYDLGKGHLTYRLGIVTTQKPTADSFDPNADLLVSELVESDTQPSLIAAKFARVGSIARVVLKGLPVGATVKSGTMSFPDFWSPYCFEIDPVANSAGLSTLIKGAKEINFQPQGVTVDSNGEAVIWLRTASGTLDNWFAFRVLVNNGSDAYYSKTVDLHALSKTLVFDQGKLTKFSVTLAAE